MKTKKHIFTAICLCLAMAGTALRTNAQAITQLPVTFTYTDDMDFTGWGIVPEGRFDNRNTTDLIMPELDLSKTERPFIVVDSDEITTSVSSNGIDYMAIETGMVWLKQDTRFIRFTKAATRWPRSFNILINDLKLKATPLHNTFPLVLNVWAGMAVSDWTISGIDMAGSQFVISSKIDMSGLQNPFIEFASPDDVVTAYVSSDGNEWTEIASNQAVRVSKGVKYVMVDRKTRSDWETWDDEFFRITIYDALIDDFPWYAECTGNADYLDMFTYEPFGDFRESNPVEVVSPMLDLSDLENPMLVTTGHNVLFAISTDGKNFASVSRNMIPLENTIKFVKVVRTSDKWDWGNSYFAMQIASNSGNKITSVPYTNAFNSFEDVFGFEFNHSRYWGARDCLVAFDAAGASVTLPELDLPIAHAYALTLSGSGFEVLASADGVAYDRALLKWEDYVENPDIYIIPSGSRFLRIVSTQDYAELKSITIDIHKQKLQPLTSFYDFWGNGTKGFVSNSTHGIPWSSSSKDLYISHDIFHGFAIERHIGTSDVGGEGFSVLLDDVNLDGHIDIGIVLPYQNDTIYMSRPDGSYYKKDGFFFPNGDLNMDGRIDLLKYIYSDAENYIEHQQPNGTFNKIYMKAMTPEEYEASLNREAYEAYLQAVQAGKRSSRGPGYGLSGLWIGGQSAPLPDSRKPSQCLDLNGDGVPDLLAEKTGLALYGTENEQRYVASMIGNRVTARDLNNDGFTDFVIWDETAGQLKTLVYRGNGEYAETVLMNDIMADKKVYCYDFDGDGDIDILATFSYPYNNIGSFWIFAANDGNANFTITEEATTNKYFFDACLDLNNDGYYDLLAIDVTNLDPKYRKGTYTTGIPYEHIGINSNVPAPVKILWGQAGLTFSSPELLYEAQNHPSDLLRYSNNINAADIDNDGKFEIWFTEDTYIHEIENANALTRPTAPPAPTFVFDVVTGRLDINWEAGSDTKVSACDLTYALRIGTQPGLGDMLYAHANTDGSRRNFAEGNMGYTRSKVLDANTWPPGTYYISVQTINPSHLGSVWSSETVFQNTYLSSTFSVDKQSLAFCDSLAVYYTPLPEGYTLHWKLDNAEQLASSAAGTIYLKWATGGIKTISLQIEAPDGLLSEKTEKTIEVLSNKITATKTPDLTFTKFYQGWFADWNTDGTHDLLHPDDGLYKNDGNGNFTKLGKIFNLNFAPDYGKWMDWDMDGVVDLFYHENDTYGYLQNHGSDDNFTKTGITLQLDGVYHNGGSLYNTATMADLDHDGRLEPLAIWNNKLLKNEGNGVFSSAYVIDNEAIGGYDFYALQNVMDWNRDGYLDYYWFSRTSTGHAGTDVYYGIKLLENHGGYHFEYKYIPFDNPVTKVSWDKIPFVDFDNDGFIDMAYSANNKRIQILRNVGNEYFEEGISFTINDDRIAIVSGQYSYEYYNNPITIGDLDNNGYPDLLVNVTIEGQTNGVYVFYNDGNGAYRQGLLSDMTSNTSNFEIGKYAITDTDNDGIPDIYLGGNYRDDGYLHYNTNNTHAANTPPQTPTGVIATQTDDVLIIEWDDAVDNETPDVQMRYNLSVKKKGATGAGSYIISPLNGGNGRAAALPSPKGGLYIDSDGSAYASRLYVYPTATRFEIPLSALPVGELEISVQAIDLWDAVSDFSPTLVKKIESTASFKMPSTACFDSPIEIVYSGAQGGTSTPIWNFDDGTIVSGSGYGPYMVQWDSEGVKTISLTLGGETVSTQIKVLPDFSAQFGLADHVFYQTEMEITLPAVSPSASFTWELLNSSSIFIESVIEAKPGNKKGTIIIQGGGERYRQLTLTVTQNGCEKSYTHGFDVVPKMEPPVIELVVPNSSNKNVINWDSNSLPDNTAQVVVYKEGSAINNFSVIGRVNNSSITEFTDVASNNAVKSERYAISAVLNTGIESPKSDIHQTLHLTINKGMMNNQWNLIWTSYQGRAISSYRILRGAHPDNMSQLAVVSGAVLSYTDYAPNADESYYALEYLPVESGGSKEATADRNSYIRSNVVHTGDSRSIIYMTRMNILTVESNPVLSESQPSISLYTEVFPANTTYQNIAWSIESGGALASIDQTGRLQAKGVSGGGSVTVRATAIDGSGVTNTRSFSVESFTVLSNNTRLASLTLSAGTLSPAFNADTYNYTAEVPYSVSSVTVSATAEDAKATVAGAGNQVLEIGLNRVYITVTAENGDLKVYDIAITRNEYVASGNANLSGLSVSTGTLTPVFNTDTYNYNVEVANSETSITINATAADAKATVSGTGNKSLSVGENPFDITVTAEDGITKKVYKVTVTRQKSSDATLKSLTVSSGTLSPSFSPSQTNYTVNVEYDVSTITITASPNHQQAQVTGTGTHQLTVGETSLTVTVTAEDGQATNKYMIKVNRANATTSDDATLKSITISQGALSPTFSPSTTAYTVTLDPSVASVHIDAETNHAAATVTGTGTKEISADGDTFILQVTAEDNKTTKEYSITIEHNVGIAGNEIAPYSFKIYPVPTYGILNIESEVSHTEPLIRVFDIGGRLIMEQRSRRIDLSGKESGLYIIEVNGERRPVVKM